MPPLQPDRETLGYIDKIFQLGVQLAAAKTVEISWSPCVDAKALRIDFFCCPVPEEAGGGNVPSQLPFDAHIPARKGRERKRRDGIVRR